MFRKLLLLVWLCLSIMSSVRATHILGGEISYEHISGDNYRIKLVLYADCSSKQASSLDRANVNPVITLLDSGIEKTKLHLLKEQNTGKEVPIICPKDRPNTSCSGGPLPGLKEYIFSRDISLPYKSADWKFIFKGELTSAPSAGRTNSITNLSLDPAGSYMYLEATLNNNFNNSTPRYTALPAAYFCINVQHRYDPGAQDKDYDSLEFILEPAYEAASTPVTTVPYMPGYSAVNPLHCKNFVYSSQNGSISFLPDILQYSIVVQRTVEYRNGKVAGSSMRELSFIVVNCNNNAPEGQIDAASVSGGVLSGEYTISTCREGNYLSFDIQAGDKNGDNVTVTSSDLPPGSSLVVSGNNTSTPKISFRWPNVKLPNNDYRFFIHLADNGCPLVAARTIVVNIKGVTNDAKITHTVLRPTGCILPQYTQFNVFGGALPRQLEIRSGANIIQVLDDTTGIVKTYLHPGSYSVSIRSPLPCNQATYHLDVVDSGEYPVPPYFEELHYCLNDPVKAINLVPKNGEGIKWYDIDGNALNGPPAYTTDSVRQYRWLVSSYYETCESKKLDFTIDIHPLPRCSILDLPGEVCLGDKIPLKAKGGETYIWLPEEKIYKDGDSDYYTKIMEPTVYSCIAISEYGCRDTASVYYDNIIPCCTFSYPNAFTPNGDGINDGFKIITYGNQEYYLLRIFDRWGKEVFSSNSPTEYWHGRYAGKQCEIGTYYYYFRSKCLTGQTEEKKGEIHLLR